MVLGALSMKSKVLNTAYKALVGDDRLFLYPLIFNEWGPVKLTNDRLTGEKTQFLLMFTCVNIHRKVKLKEVIRLGVYVSF